MELLLPVTDRQKLLSCDRSLYFYAAFYDTVTVTRLLVEAGIDVNASFEDAGIEFEYQPRVFENSDIDVWFGRHHSPLGAIAIYGFPIGVQHARALLDAGAYPDAQRPCRFPPLLAALDDWKLELAQCLVSCGASVNIYHRRVIGNMSLIVCLDSCSVLSLMLRCGAEPESLFGRPPPQDRTTMVDCSDDSEDCETPITLPRVLTAYQDLMREYEHTDVAVARVLHLLLQFTGSVRLDEGLADHVNSTDECLSLQAIAGQSMF